jgi:predicted dehydrogenase
MDMASHDFDMARFLVGSEIEEVRGRGGVEASMDSWRPFKNWPFCASSAS